MLRRLLAAIALLILSATPVWCQVTVMPVPVQSFTNASGLACNGCLLETYGAGTSTPLTTYQDAAATVPHANPVVLNSVGRPDTGTPIYLSPTTYKFVLKTSGGSTIWTADNVLAVPATTTGVSNAADITFQVDSDNNGSNKFSFLNGTLIEKANLNETGDLQLDGILTVDGGNIVFPATQVPVAGANTLDDYEEGSWTPVIGGSGGTSGQAYANQIGRYVKVGKLCTLQFLVELSTEGTITSNVQIQGLPATCTSENTTSLTSIVALRWAGLATNWLNVIGRLTPNMTVIDVTGATAAAANNGTALTAADIGNTSVFEGTITYRATN